jgi:hypothetical protein
MVGMFTSLYSDGLRRVQSARTREAFSILQFFGSRPIHYSPLHPPYNALCPLIMEWIGGLNENLETFNLRFLKKAYTKMAEPLFEQFS